MWKVCHSSKDRQPMNNDLKNIDVLSAKKHFTQSAKIIYLILMFVKNIIIVLVFIIWMEHFVSKITKQNL